MKRRSCTYFFGKTLQIILILTVWIPCHWGLTACVFLIALDLVHQVLLNMLVNLTTFNLVLSLWGALQFRFHQIVHTISTQRCETCQKWMIPICDSFNLSFISYRRSHQQKCYFHVDWPGFSWLGRYYINTCCFLRGFPPEEYR